MKEVLTLQSIPDIDNFIREIYMDDLWNGEYPVDKEYLKNFIREELPPISELDLYQELRPLTTQIEYHI